MTAEARSLALRTHLRDLLLDGRPPCQALGPGLSVLLTEHFRVMLRTPEAPRSVLGELPYALDVWTRSTAASRRLEHVLAIEWSYTRTLILEFKRGDWEGDALSLCLPEQAKDGAAGVRPRKPGV